jgi:hypothetical protein
MLQTYAEKPLNFPFLFEAGDPEPPGSKGDPEPPGIKPPTNQQPGNVGDGGIKPPTASGGDAEPPDNDADIDPPIIISGGGGNS